MKDNDNKEFDINNDTIDDDEYDPVAEQMFDDIVGYGYGGNSDLFWE